MKLENVIYGDLLFAIDFSMDFLALYIVSKVLHNRVVLPYMILAACVGAGYAVADIALGGNRIFSAAIGSAVAVLMCYISFGGGVKLLRSAILFYAVNLLMGGGMTALYAALNRLRGGRTMFIDGAYRTFYGDISLSEIAVFASVCFLLCIGAGRLFSPRSSVRSLNVHAEYRGRSVDFSALVDSGNLLTDPLSGRPVIIADGKRLSHLFSDEFRDIYDECLGSGDLSALTAAPTADAKRIRLFPSGGAFGSVVLVGILPDRVCVGGVEKDAFIAAVGRMSNYDSGVQREHESAGAHFGGCEGLVPAILTD